MTFLLGLHLYTVKVNMSCFSTLLLCRSAVGSIAADGGSSRLIRLTVPTILVLRNWRSLARLRDVKKLSVVTFLPFPRYGSINFMTTLSARRWPTGRVSSFPKYGKPFTKYLDDTSTASQNLMPNLSGLDAMYCVHLHRTFVGNSCSSTAMFSPGL